MGRLTTTEIILFLLVVGILAYLIGYADEFIGSICTILAYEIAERWKWAQVPENEENSPEEKENE